MTIDEYKAEYPQDAVFIQVAHENSCRLRSSRYCADVCRHLMQ
jgi:hypothetical protein